MTAYRPELLLFYRVMAIVTGTTLVLLVFVATPLKYFAHSPGAAAVIGTGHGFLFIIYLLATLLLGVQLRWKPLRMALVMLAGIVPFLTFVAERKVVAEVRGRQRA